MTDVDKKYFLEQEKERKKLEGKRIISKGRLRTRISNRTHNASDNKNKAQAELLELKQSNKKYKEEIEKLTVRATNLDNQRTAAQKHNKECNKIRRKLNKENKELKKLTVKSGEKSSVNTGRQALIPTPKWRKDMDKVNRMLAEKNRMKEFQREEQIKDARALRRSSSHSGGRKKTRKRRKRKKKKTRRRRRRKGTKKKRKKRIKNITRKDKCAPKKTGETLEFTCYTKASLRHMKDLWNARHPDGMITSTDPYTIWKQLGDNMRNTCNRESCWMKQHWAKENLDKKVKKHTFAPTQPSIWKKKPTEWLTSIDILNVMRQYEEKHNDFEFIGPSPIDFDTHKMHGECVWDELCKFSLKKQKDENKKRIGIIFNLDPHDKPGSHWVACFIDMYKKEIYYFDSYGDRTPSKIKIFVKRVAKESKHFGKKYNFKVNKRRHQYSDSECGMYCLHFIIEMAKGSSFEKFQKIRHTDKLMKKLRGIYFNKI